MTWEWDPTLFAGSAQHYPRGRMPYPARLASVLQDALGLDGTGRLLDVGCGPGSLTALLAPLHASSVGIDADPDMLAEAARSSGAPRVVWRALRAEDLPADLGLFRTVTFAQSFHWMRQEEVADAVRGMLDEHGAWVHVASMTHRGVDGDDPLPHPRPPWTRLDALVATYLGPVRRAGQGTLPGGTRSGEDDVMRAAGYAGPERLVVSGGDAVPRSADDVLASLLSMSSSAPHLFGDRLGAFAADVRAVLLDVAPDGMFSERTHDVEVAVWRP
ncbi:class I SAM-dependent methyltransferase [Cellulomonas sp.]|uniref:class I SAM-dependent methyltransferase n=1 Tax=Cellulomonas sp. TaxID=40001 RepID=UPI001B115C43|nr:class I SAM-dependent methyltransferase [Cellulomonas sp.]MBO9555065.1 methyltransferase domain-containing protein [Cellulomonas sp.]